MSMTGSNPKSEVLNGPERRRRRTPAEKLALVAETEQPGVTVSLVARRHGIAPNQLFLWRRLASQGALTATGAEEPVVPASEYRSLQGQVRELQRLWARRRWKLRSSRRLSSSQRAQKNICCGRCRGRRTVRNEDRLQRGRSGGSNIAAMTKAPLAKPLGRPPQPEAHLLAEIKAVIGDIPTYAYRRVWAVLRRAAEAQGLQPPNHKRVYRS